jgi:predicted DCC family thiol-disulfide oxidoreductase YuxK
MSDSAGWVFYDGACGVCSRLVSFWEPTLRRIGLDVAPLQTPWVRERIATATPDPLADILLLLPNDTMLRGADVYRYVMRRVWWTYPFSLLSHAPILSRVFDGAYRAFADHRHRVSSACAVEPPPP